MASATARSAARHSGGAQIVGSGLAGSPVRNDVEGDLLAFPEIVHAGALDRADVDENVRAASVLRDEAKAVLGNHFRFWLP